MMDESQEYGFGGLLKRYRGRAGLTQEELAEAAGLSVRGLSDLERGLISAPRVSTVQLLIEALRLSGPERLAFESLTRRRPTVPTHRDDRPGCAVAPLPQPLTSLVGRDRDVQMVGDLLSLPAVRLLTLTGPGGVGKTRLAVRVAEEARARYPDGVFFVPLAAITDVALVAPAIAQAVGATDADNHAAREVLIAALGARHALVVLDNVEQLTAAAALLVELLTACVGLTFMVTSRTPLHVQGEHEFTVAPLGLPPLNPQPAVDEIDRSAAVTLFVQRARAVDPTFTLTATNAATLAILCRRLDGLPLALELAAARLKLLPPPALLARLDHSLRVLTGGAHDLPPRQQTLRATIAWSYDLLERNEQILFHRLAVFADSWTLDAAEAVCQGDDAAPLDVLDLTASLLDKSLLCHAARRVAAPAERGGPGDPRVTMLETIRAYGLERLGASGEEAAVRQAHARYYLALAEQAAPRLTGPDQRAWLDRLDEDVDNMRAALTWACDATQSLQRDAHDDAASLGLRLAGALWRFWEMRSHLMEGRAWLDRLLDLTPDVAPVLRIGALNGAGILAHDQGDLDRAAEWLEQSLALGRRLGDEPAVAVALTGLGMTLRDQGRFEQARAALEEGLAIRHALNDSAGRASTLNKLGTLALLRGDLATANALLEESLILARQAGHIWMAGAALHDLGLVASDEGDYQRAAALFEESLSVWRKVRDEHGQATALERLAAMASHQGAAAAALALYAQSLALARRVGDRAVIAADLDALAHLAMERGSADLAVRLLAAGAAARPAAGVEAEQDTARHVLAAARSAHGEARVAAWWAAARAAPLAQAIDEALTWAG